MNDTELYERLRAADPAAEIDGDPHSPAAHRVRQRIRRSDVAPAARRGFPRKRLIGLTAAVLMILTSGVAIGIGIFRPDPEDVSIILGEYADATDVHGKGWRPALSTELVWCIYPDGRSIQPTASEFPLDEALTKRRLIDECASGNDLVRGREAPGPFTLCEGLVAAEDIELVLDELDQRIIEGSLDGDHRHFPVVLGWDADCAGTTQDTWPKVQLRELTSLNTTNQAREIEISLRAAAIEHCLTQDEAMALAKQARSHLLDDWPIVETTESPNCHEITLDHWGLIKVR